MSIPHDLDRALALAVLDELRGLTIPDRPADGPPVAVDAAVSRIVDVLRAQGAHASEVMLALDDAFAALLAGRDRPAHRQWVRALAEAARARATARLGYGARPHGSSWRARPATCDGAGLAR